MRELEKDNNIEDRKLLRDMIDSINSSTDIVVQNLRRKDGSNITRSMLSTGTERLLNLIRYVNEIIDTIFIINCDSDDIQIDKLIDLQIDGGRVNGDALVANLYKRKKISCHPDKEQIDLFLSNFKNNRIDF